MKQKLYTTSEPPGVFGFGQFLQMVYPNLGRPCRKCVLVQPPCLSSRNNSFISEKSDRSVGTLLSLPACGKDSSMCKLKAAAFDFLTAKAFSYWAVCSA